MAFGNSGSLHREPSLFSAIAIGVSCIIGSGWLFACYKTAQLAGPVAILSWVIGAALALIIALLLSEIASIYHKERGLFSRLLTITHNRDYGFVISIANWLISLMIIPAEAEASIQYLATVFPEFSHIVFLAGHFTAPGIALVCIMMLFYSLINYWGIRVLAKINNFITLIKLVVPVLTAIVILYTAFHGYNFTEYKGTIAPYGYDKAFSAVVTCGIFYSFYGFSAITLFAKELKNPKRNVPLALFSSVFICLIIYVLLQTAFIGAISPSKLGVSGGWHTLSFTSPLAQLAMLLGLNWLVIVLYADAVISPSGTGIVYLGSSVRTLSGMASDGQMPSIFAKTHAKHQISRLSLIITLIFCASLVIFFDNWDKIMIVLSVFLLLSCLAVPIAYCRIKLNNIKTDEKNFKLPCGVVLSYLSYFALSYLLIECGTLPLVLSLIFSLVFFALYCLAQYRNIAGAINAVRSAWSIFVYMALSLVFGYFHVAGKLGVAGLIVYLILLTINFHFLVRQKSYNT